VLRGAKQNSERRPFVWFLHVAVECLQIELEPSQMLWLKFVDFELEHDQAIERAVEEEQV
jgi:hypothetical protein